MKNIVLSRIDDRLIHGQVITSWHKALDFNVIVVCDDGVCKDMFMQRILKAAAPASTTLKCLTVEQTIEFLKEDPTSPNERVAVLTKGPFPYEAIIRAGIKLDHVMLGGMLMKAGRTSLYLNSAADPEERACIRRIIEELNTPVLFRRVEREKPVDLHSYL